MNGNGAIALPPALVEIREFASFTAAEQRYIRRSLDVAAVGPDATDRWARGIYEATNIGHQARNYGAIGELQILLSSDLDPEDTSTVLPALIRISAVDLQNGKLTSFGSYRFLYERLLGPAARPWLLSAFMAAAALPCIHPELRGELFKSVSKRSLREIGWSSREPAFVPQWVEKVPLALL